MHPNYQFVTARSGAAASSQESILSNRAGVAACALRDAGDTESMR
jgi:hypothetical protein